MVADGARVTSASPERREVVSVVVRVWRRAVVAMVTGTGRNRGVVSPSHDVVQSLEPGRCLLSSRTS